MTKKFLLIFFALSLLLYFSHQELRATQTVSAQEKALQALKSQDFSAAIKICLKELEQNPDDYEWNFILSRAYAFSGQWDKALSLLDEMLRRYPQNIDLLLFRARVAFWKGDYKEAKSGYQEVLMFQPWNIEALTGMAEISAKQKDYEKAIAIYQQILARDPNQAEIYYRIGKVYEWEGKFEKARENFSKAGQLDPSYKEYSRALTQTSPRLEKKFEIRYGHSMESFSDNRDNYIEQQFALNLRLPKDFASLFLEYDQTKRYKAWDRRFGMEFYPRLLSKGYAYLEFHYSPKALYYPRISWTVEGYQVLFSSAEFSLGYRRMNFKTEAVSIYLGSLGYYFGNYYSYLRLYHAPEGEGDSLSWFLNIRRYFSKENFLFAGYGRGSRPFEIVTLEDARVRRSWLLLAGFNWTLFDKIRLQFYFTHRSENSGLRRDSFLLITGYRW